MKKLLIILSVLFIPLVVWAKVGTRNLEEDVKHELVCLHEFQVIATATTTDVQGMNGNVFETSVASITTPTSTASAVTSPMTIMWPSKLRVILVDAFPVATLTCTSVVLKGEDQFGSTVAETVSTISETASLSTNVYSKLTSVSGAGCASGGTGDVLQVMTSSEIGLGRKVSSYKDIEALCLWDDSVSGDPWGCAHEDNGTDDDIESAFEASSNSVDISSTVFWSSSSTAAFAAGDGICFRVRSSKTTGY